MGPKSAKLNVALFFGPILLGCLVVIDLRLFFIIPYFFGFWLFFKSKMSVIKQETAISFGARNMSYAMKKSYYLGYAIMIITAAFNFAIFLKINYAF